MRETHKKNIDFLHEAQKRHAATLKAGARLVLLYLRN